MPAARSGPAGATLTAVADDGLALDAADAEAKAAEHAVSRIAGLVLHASAIAERLRLLPDHSDLNGDRPARVERLEDVASRGQLVLQRIATRDGAMPETASRTAAACARPLEADTTGHLDDHSTSPQPSPG